jgi:hypothetical protein
VKTYGRTDDDRWQRCAWCRCMSRFMRRARKEENAAISPSPTDACSREVQCERMHFRVYLDVFGGWRWEFRLANGQSHAAKSLGLEPSGPTYASFGPA